MSSRKSSNRHQRPKGRTDWDELADWYDGWVGREGGRYHRTVAIPAVLRLLAPQRGERILDIGCGQGVLAPHILAANARYTGIDLSRRLIELARRRRAGAVFLEGDARDIAGTTSLRSESFDAAVILFSLQDIDPLEAALDSATEMLRPGGRLVFLITHPAFRIPRQSGWGWDPARKLRYRRVDAYVSRMAIPLKPRREQATMRSYHRPIGDYLNGLAATGLAVEAMAEPVPLISSVDQEREEFPLYLAVMARKGLLAAAPR